MGSYKKLFLTAILLAAVLAAVFYYLGNLVPANPNVAKDESLTGAPATAQYLNPDFGISLEYPSSWRPVVGKKEFKKIPLYLGRTDGFFGIDALGASVKGQVSIDDVVKSLVSDKSNPYGTSPSIGTPDTGKIETRMIVPSDNQLPEKNGEAAFVLRYPKPKTIGDNTFPFFMLYGDKAHIGEIINSLKLIE